MVKNKKGFIGIDLGTSSIKTILCDSFGNVLSEASDSFNLIIEKNLFVEQNPNDWYDSMIKTLKSVLKKYNGVVEAISFSGQMHGLVMMDNNNNLLGNAILWNDQRSYKEVENIKKEIGIKNIMEETGNMPIEGFILPKLLWLRRNNEDLFGKINKIMLPKDYLIYKLSNLFVTDVTDASGTGMFNVEKREWSKYILEKFKINKDLLPKVYESCEEVGFINLEESKKIGINNKTRIIVGAGDQAANALGLGVTKEGRIALSLGTSACVFAPTLKFAHDENLHSFANSDGKYHLMGVSQSGGGSVKWFFEEILGIKDYSIIKNLDYKKSNNVFFLPYLTGERHPIHDPLAKGLFIGMDRSTTNFDMLKSVLEGVAFSIKQILLTMKNHNIEPKEIVVAGGGGNNESWMKILSSVLNIKVSIIKGNYGGALGAAIIAMVGSGMISSFEDAFNKFIKIEKEYFPDKNLKIILLKKYSIWEKIYPSVKKIYKSISDNI